MAGNAHRQDGRDSLHDKVESVLTKGECPIPDPEIEEDETAAAAAAIGLDEGPAARPNDADDDLTPATLIGDHRDGKWAAREDERDH